MAIYARFVTQWSAPSVLRDFPIRQGVVGDVEGDQGGQVPQYEPGGQKVVRVFNQSGPDGDDDVLPLLVKLHIAAGLPHS